MSQYSNAVVTNTEQLSMRRDNQLPVDYGQRFNLSLIDSIYNEIKRLNLNTVAGSLAEAKDLSGSILLLGYVCHFVYLYTKLLL